MQRPRIHGRDRGLLSLLFHFLAFAVIGAIERGARSRTDVGTRSSALPLRGLLLCVLLELGQAFFAGRHPELADLAVNALGLAVGSSIAWAGFGLAQRPGFAHDGRWIRVRLAAWGIVWSAAIALPATWVALDGWDREYPLLFGNENTANRPWHGELTFVAFYDRALGRDEIVQLAGLAPDTPVGAATRRTAGLLTAYDFGQRDRLLAEPEGRVRDAGLRLRVPESARWTSTVPARLVVPEAGLIKSRGATGVLTSEMSSPKGFTIEARFKTASVTQGGPARIVSVSESEWKRNVTLGQEKGALNLRVRNRINGDNGRAFELKCEGAVVEGPQDVVATYHQGVSTLFRNGLLACAAADLRQQSVLLGLGASRVGGAVAGAIAAVSLLAMAGGRTRLYQLFFIGYASMLWPLAASPILPFKPPMTIHLWFGPALVCSWFLLSRAHPLEPGGNPAA